MIGTEYQEGDYHGHSVIVYRIDISSRLDQFLHITPGIAFLLSVGVDKKRKQRRIAVTVPGIDIRFEPEQIINKIGI